MAAFAERPGMAEAFVPLPGPNRGIPVEFRQPARAMGAQTTNNVSLVFNVQSLDPRGSGEVVAKLIPQIEDAVAGALQRGTNRNLLSAVRNAASSS
jgi:hypothetical protein